MRLSALDLSPLADDLPDATLLGRFLTDRDEVAFAELVARHGPMVLGVCRRVLGDSHAAEDAFQATFLVLVRRAADAAHGHLGPWLYGVAYRTALKSRVAALRRSAREQKVAASRPASTTPGPEPVEVAELAAVLDEELGRLPGPLRTAVILCDLQGLSRRQAARRLGCPEGTLSGRLTVARQRLADQLTRRGVAVVLTGLIAAVPTSLARETCSAALAAATGAAAGVPVPVARLSNEVIRTMTRPHKLAAAAVAACAALLIATAAILADADQPATTSVPAGAERPAAQPRDPGATPALANRPEQDKKNPLDAVRFVAFDGFDGKPALNWKPIRPDESHLSYKKHPGQLTIVTQKGTIHGDAEKADPNLPAKNIYVIENPLAPDRDFVVTTCIVEFRPKAAYHQAGLILYDDDDNYLKFTFEYDFSGQAPTRFVVVNEQNADPKHEYAEANPEISKLWMRLSRRGTSYDYATSIDGERFVTHGTTEWGKTGPKMIGLIAKNGGEKEVEELDARFEFFELRTP
jgi:RNA polymerase sigma factor (sigma-70 family)